MQDARPADDTSFPAVLRGEQGFTPTDLWRSLGFFGLYRLVVGAVLVFSAALLAEAMGLSAQDHKLFFWISVAYAGLTVLSALAVGVRKPAPGWQLAVQVCTDIAAIGLLSYFSGGVQNNLAMLLLVTLAFAGLISRGRITLLYAALASLAILFGHAYAVLVREAPVAQFFQVGMLASAYFAVAWLAHALSRYALASEKLAARRAVDLSSMAEANRLLIQDLPDGVLVVDERGRVRQSNPAAARMLGYRFAVDGEDRLAQCAPLLDALFAAWRQNPALGREVLRLPPANQWVRVRFLAVEREGFWGAVVVLEDIQRAQAQAQQVKLAALGRLTANIAHEVRNPLSSINYAAELLKEGGLDPARERLFQIILDNASRLNRIVQDVMQVNRRDRVQAESIALAQRLPLFVDELCRVENIRREIVTVEVGTDVQIRFDPGHLEQVLWNLCRNALRYCQGKDGSVRLCVRTGTGGEVTLEVRDDGPGIAPTARQKLFEPFHTTEAGGTGLGLYIARELSEANGAVLDYCEQETGGACFCMTCGRPVNEGG
ncbi:MAG: two-component system sensor histidine kinase PilS [Sideroxydans sp.]